jgi:hypothetical protein
VEIDWKEAGKCYSSVLQTSALPLGYAAGNRDEGGGMRDEEKSLSFIPHPSALILSKRETGFEPATSTLARSHSTAELLPRERLNSTD